MATGNNIPEISRRLKAVMVTIPAKVGAVMLDFTSKRFRQQNWHDTTPVAWHPRKNKKGKDATRAILVKSARLKRASIIRLTGNSATISNNTPYARVHNEGINTTVQVKAFSRKRFKSTRVKEDGKRAKTLKSVTGETPVKAHQKKMRITKRQFIGNSVELNHQIERLINLEILKVFSNGKTN